MVSYIEIKAPPDDSRTEKLIEALKEELPGFEVRTTESLDGKFHPGTVHVGPGHRIHDGAGRELSGGPYVQAVQRIITRVTGDWL